MKTQSPIPDLKPATEGYVDLPDVRLWYWDTGGEGDVIVLSHPASQSCQIWGYQQAVLVAAGYRVIAYSRRGVTRSEKGPAHDPGTTVGDLVALLDGLSIDRAHLVGAAAGGIAVLACSIAHPARARSLVLAGTIFSLVEDEWRSLYGRLGLADVRDVVSTEFLELGPSYRATNPEGTARFAALSAEAHNQGPIKQPSGVDVTFAALAANRVPTLLVTGEADLYAPPPLQMMVASHMAATETDTIREVGHAAYWEQPDVFNEMVLRFLSQHRSDA